MTFRLLIAAGLVLLPASAALAQIATHSESGPLSGRSPVKTYRPVARALNCNPVQPHRQTGKIPLPPIVLPDRGCAGASAGAVEVAERASEQRQE